MAALDFNPMAYEPLGEGFTVFPAGKYPVSVKKTEIKATQDRSSGYLQLDMEILDGPHRGQTYNYRCNIYNASADAREFASRMLTSICFACGFFQPITDSDQLRGIPFIVSLDEQEMEYRPQDDRSKPKKKSNNLIAVYDVHGNLPQRPGNGAGAPPAGAPTGAPAYAPAAAPAGAPAEAPYTPPAAAPASPAGWTGAPASAAPAGAAPAWTPPAAGAPAAAPGGVPSWAAAPAA